MLGSMLKEDRLKAILCTLSIEDIEALYGETIIRRYLERQRQEKQVRKLSNLSRGTSSHKANANFRHAQIISLVLNRISKQDIMTCLRVSRSTIDRALRGLDAKRLSDIVAQYQETIFANLDKQAYKEFIESGCSYAKFHKKMTQ